MIARSTGSPTVWRRGFALAVAAVLVTSGCGAGRDSQTANQVSTQQGTDANAGTMLLRGVLIEAPRTGAAWPAGSGIPMRLVLVNDGTSNDRLTGITTSVARGWASYSSAAVAKAASAQQTSSRTPGSSGPSASTTPGTSSTSASAGTSPTTGTSSTGATSSSSKSTSHSTSPAKKKKKKAVGSTSVIVPAGQRVSWGVPDSTKVLLLLSSLGRIYPGSSVKVTFTFSKAGSVTVVVPVQLSSYAVNPTVGTASGD